MLPSTISRGADSEKYKGVIKEHFDRIRSDPQNSELLGTKRVRLTGDGPHEDHEYDPEGHILLQLRKNIYGGKDYAKLHIKDVDINSFFPPSYLLK